MTIATFFIRPPLGRREGSASGNFFGFMESRNESGIAEFTKTQTGGGKLATIDDFAALDIRVGTVKEAEFFGEAKIPAIKLKIDFGPEIGMKSSSAQITKRYKAEEMIGKQIIGIVNFPPRRIAGFQSEVLVLRGVPEQGDVILLKPEIEIPNGTPIR